jgi:hypothetical protein
MNTEGVNIVHKNIERLSSLIRNILNNKNNTYVKRKKKTNIFDAFAFRIINVLNNESEQSTVSYINSFKNTNITKKAYVDRDNQIDLEFYENIIRELSFNTKDTKIEENIISVDGTDLHLNPTFAIFGYPENINGKCVMPLVTGVYNITEKCPVYLQIEKHFNERKSILEYIQRSYNIENMKDTNIYIFDRGYYSKDFIYKLNQLGIKYIIRSNSTKLINAGLDDKHFVEYGTNDNIIKINNEDVRILRYKIGNNTYILTTNLVKRYMYSLNTLKELYQNRWRIEEYFKFIKTVTKFDNMQQKSEKTMQKMILAIILFTLIFNKICNIFGNLFTDSEKTFNRTLVLRGLIKTQFILKMIYNKRITKDYIQKFCNNYVIPYRIQNNRHYPRKSNNPNKKWYLKSNLSKLHNSKTIERQAKENEKIISNVNKQIKEEQIIKDNKRIKRGKLK